MLDQIAGIIAHSLVLLTLGILLNLLAVLMDESAKAGKPVHPIQHFKAKPYRTALAVIASFAGYGALASQGPVEPLTALVLGYAGSDVLNRLISATTEKMARGAA